MDELNKMRALRYARAKTPFTDGTPARKALVAGLRDAGHLTITGRGKTGVLMAITPSGEQLLKALEATNPDVPDYALKQAIARHEGR